jgi:hypothetical protein
MGTIEEVPSLSKEEVAKIQAKAIKVSRDVMHSSLRRDC